MATADLIKDGKPTWRMIGDAATAMVQMITATALLVGATWRLATQSDVDGIAWLEAVSISAILMNSVCADIEQMKRNLTNGN